MKTRRLRHIVDRYGVVGLLLVGAYLGGKRLWAKRRVVILAALAILLAGTYTFDFFYNRSVSRDGINLYLGRNGTPPQEPLRPLDARILEYWEEGNRTEEVRGLARQFARYVEQQNRVGAIRLGDQLARLFRPSNWASSHKDGVWRFHAVTGEIYLEQAWLEEAEREFWSILVAVPPGEPGWGKSFARQRAAYGLARVSALRGSYGDALEWLSSAPGEYNGGCGNANEAEADDNYPLQVVWTAATKPFRVAEAELRQVMQGRFTPRKSWLNGDTSQEQREHAAIEAALTLGCLYDEAGRRKDARVCWRLVASNADARHEATMLAQSMLCRTQGK